jgi:branched-chain amino acid transport system permease protein
VLEEWRLIAYGFLFVLIMVFRPQGLLGYVEMNFNFLKAGWNRLFPRKSSRGEVMN